MAELPKTGDTPVAPILDRQPDFDIFLRTVKAEDIEGRPVLTVTASSDEIDLGSDRFTMSALSQMEKAFESLTIFLNHKYLVPEDVFGIVTRAALIDREGHTDLDLTIAVENKNARAITVYEMIRNGTHLGVSVGVLVLDADYADEQVMDRQVLEITSIVPLEASIVGIPANRRSWVQGALKAASALASGQRIDPSNLGKFRTARILEGPLGMPTGGDDDMSDRNTRTEDAIAMLTYKVAELEAGAGNEDAIAMLTYRKAELEAGDVTQRAIAMLTYKVAELEAYDTAQDAVAMLTYKIAELEAASGTGKGGSDQKSLREEVAAEEFTDRFYTLFRATYYALYEIIASETPVDVKRGEAQKILNDFAELAREMVDETLAVLSNAPADEFAAIQEDLAHDLKAAWKSAEADQSLPAGDLEAVGSLINQVTRAEDANAMLTYRKAELEAGVEEKDALIASCGEAIRKIMALPMARKIVPESLAEDLQAMHPYLAAPIAEDLARRKAAAAKKSDRST